MMNDRPFRFGVVSYNGARSATAWRELARRTETLGYSTLFAIDHVVDTRLAPIAAMSFAAAATSDLRVGTRVFNNDLRYPGLLAKEIATIDLLPTVEWNLA